MGGRERFLFSTPTDGGLVIPKQNATVSPQHNKNLSKTPTAPGLPCKKKQKGLMPYAGSMTDKVGKGRSTHIRICFHVV